MRTLKIYSLSNFQIWTTVLVTTVTVLYVTCPGTYTLGFFALDPSKVHISRLLVMSPKSPLYSNPVVLKLEHALESSECSVKAQMLGGGCPPPGLLTWDLEWGPGIWIPNNFSGDAARTYSENQGSGFFLLFSNPTNLWFIAERVWGPLGGSVH